MAIPVAVLTLPLQALVGVLIRQKLGRPVVFLQERPGRNAELYELVKFRTMTAATGTTGKLLPDTDRLTRFAR